MLKNTSLYILLTSILSLLAGCGDRYSHTVRQVPTAPKQAPTITNYTDSTITIPAGAHYDRGRVHTFFYGKHYREAWTTPVPVKVLDIGTAKGGLTPIQLGGSRQTISLRAKNPDGIEYVLRSIDKEPAGELSDRMQKSYIANIARDATSATHPYAALVLPTMAKAIGIYHTTPELVYVPHDPRLGEFGETIAGTMVLIERRPDDNQEDNPEMGNAKKVKSTRSMLTERLTDNDTGIDAYQYLRARLFDMLIGDWSRHEDNWRWAELEHDLNAYTYRPVPRDRDNVFYKLHDAPIPWITRLLKFKPHFRTYRKNVGNLEKLNYNARHLDALLLAQLDQRTWQAIADSMQHELTDDVIDRAFKEMPQEVYAKTAPDIIDKLKSRRDQLPEFATSYYKHLAKQAIVTGSDKHEQFIVDVISPDEVKVDVYKITKEGEVKDLIFSRIYHASHTKELILYGLAGEDKFILKGAAKPKIKVSIWGGEGEDTYTTEDKKSSSGNRICIIDSTYGNNYDAGDRAKIQLNDEQRAKDFNAAGWLLRFYLD